MGSSLPNVDRYVLESEIGRGGFGAVYRARHAVLDRAVALKVLHPERQGSSSVLQRFLREAKAVAQLRSPHVVEVLDADLTADGRAFIAMELLDGEDLATRLERTGRMPTHRVVRLGREVLAGLATAHARGIVHRDLKPGNVFLARDGKGAEVTKILDFGISKVRTEDPGDELTRTGTMLGTPHYMAPEQFTASRSVDARADLYSLGTLMYEALTGRLPYDATTLEQLIAAKLADPPRPLAQVAPDVPRAVADAVMRALADDPARRFQSAAEMDAALAAVESTTSLPGIVMSSAPPAAPSTRAPQRSRAMPVLAAIAGIVLVFGFVMLALTAFGVWIAERELDAWLHPTTTAPAPPPPPSVASWPPAIAPVAPPSVAPAVAPQVAAPQVAAPQVAAPQVAAPSAPTPVVAPRSASSGPEGVHTRAHMLGAGDGASLDALVARARPELARCRGPASFHTEITFTVMAGGRLHDGQRILATPSATRDCVVDALVAAGPGPDSGIAIVDVRLDPL